MKNEDDINTFDNLFLIASTLLKLLSVSNRFTNYGPHGTTRMHSVLSSFSTSYVKSSRHCQFNDLQRNNIWYLLKTISPELNAFCLPLHKPTANEMNVNASDSLSPGIPDLIVLNKLTANRFGTLHL